jgi:hypothetical protein
LADLAGCVVRERRHKVCVFFFPAAPDRSPAVSRFRILQLIDALALGDMDGALGRGEVDAGMTQSGRDP